MCSGRSRTARETQNIPLAVPEQSIAPLKEMHKRSLPASSHLADREVFPFLFSLPKKPIPERVAVLPWHHRASHEGLQGRGAVIWCVHRDASCHLRCRLSGTYQSDSICMAFRQERHSPSGSAQTTNECLAQAPRRLALPRVASLR